MMRILMITLLAILLAGCATTTPQVPTGLALPPPPAGLKTCLNQAGVALPRRGLTVAEVERFWKTDRLAIVAQRRCGARMMAFYESLRARWR